MFTTLGKDFHVKYEGLLLICFNYRRYGHKLDYCPEKVVPMPPSVTDVSIAMVDIEKEVSREGLNINVNPINSGISEEISKKRR